MIRYRLRTLLLFTAVLGVILYVGKRVHHFERQLAAEYVTADVIRDVTQYVEAHHGEWPKSWDDVSGGDHARQYVRMNFDVKTDELVADPALIHSVIVPWSGVYYTYPHAERQLNELRDTLARFHHPAVR